MEENTPEIRDAFGEVIHVGDVVVKGGYHGGIYIGVVRGFKKSEGYWDKSWYVAVDVPAKKTRFYDPINHKSQTNYAYGLWEQDRIEVDFNGWRRCAWKKPSSNVMKISQISEQDLVEKHKIGTYTVQWSTYDKDTRERRASEIASGTTEVRIGPVT